MGLINKSLLVFILAFAVSGCHSIPEGSVEPSEITTSENNTPIKGTSYSINRDGSIIDWSDTNFSYFLDKNGNVMLYYGKSETIKAPLVLSSDANYAGPNTRNTGFFISDKKTAIAYENPNSSNFIAVMISDDKGKSWENVNVDFDSTDVYPTWIKIGFTTKDDGWMVICSFAGMGHEDHYIYTSSDGGKTWTAVEGNINSIYSRVLSGAAFIDDKLGFLCFRYEFVEFSPAVCITRDGGLTWDKTNVQLPSEYNACSQTPLSPAADGDNIILPVLLTDNNGAEETVYMKSKDNGVTWEFSVSK